MSSYLHYNTRLSVNSWKMRFSIVPFYINITGAQFGKVMVSYLYRHGAGVYQGGRVLACEGAVEALLGQCAPVGLSRHVLTRHCLCRVALLRLHWGLLAVRTLDTEHSGSHVTLKHTQ